MLSLVEFELFSQQIKSRLGSVLCQCQFKLLYEKLGKTDKIELLTKTLSTLLLSFSPSFSLLTAK